jgi:hypothetical protein
MIWKPTLIDGRYEVSDAGDVRKRINATHPERRQYVVLKQDTDRDGYKVIRIAGHRHRVHRLVYSAFIGPLHDGLVICHLNNDRADNRPVNLLQATQQENIAHKKNHGTCQSGERHPNATMSNQKAMEVKEELARARRVKGRLARGEAQRIAARHCISKAIVFGLSRSRGAYQL